MDNVYKDWKRLKEENKQLKTLLEDTRALLDVRDKQLLLLADYIK